MRKYILLIIIISLLLTGNVSSKGVDINTIKVDIKGAVNDPGVYELEPNSIVYDLIVKSGGLKEYADTSVINMSKKLSNEDVVIIYTISEIEETKEGSTSVKIIDKECTCPKINNVACVNNNKISLNTASLEELMNIPNIGKSKAASIIEYRKDKQFDRIEDIMNIKGIGQGIFDKIKEFITI